MSRVSLTNENRFGFAFCGGLTLKQPEYRSLFNANFKVGECWGNYVECWENAINQETILIYTVLKKRIGNTSRLSGG